MPNPRKLIYPHPKGVTQAYVLNGLKGMHETGGLAHNWAFDFMAPGGTPILPPEPGWIWKLSGHDPREGAHGDIFGWNTYLHTKDGLIYFFTHQGRRFVKLGQYVTRRTIIGTVGKWPNDPGRSHTHGGVTHPMGDGASKTAARNWARAPRIAVPPL